MAGRIAILTAFVAAALAAAGCESEQQQNRRKFETLHQNVRKQSEPDAEPPKWHHVGEEE